MKTSAPLSKTQYGLYIECMKHPGEPCYIIPFLSVFDGSLDEERLRKAVETAVSAHPTLFTRIELTDQGEPVQTIDDGETFSALRAFALSLALWCYIDTLMVVYKLYSYHGMSLFISFIISLMVIPVLWIVSFVAPSLIWYSYLIAYILEFLLILLFHRVCHLKFELQVK